MSNKYSNNVSDGIQLEAETKTAASMLSGIDNPWV
jgi:hypothetical protein